MSVNLLIIKIIFYIVSLHALNDYFYNLKSVLQQNVNYICITCNITNVLTFKLLIGNVNKFMFSATTFSKYNRNVIYRRVITATR